MRFFAGIFTAFCFRPPPPPPLNTGILGLAREIPFQLCADYLKYAQIQR